MARKYGPNHDLHIEPLSGSAPGAATGAVPTTFIDDWGEVQALSPQVVQTRVQAVQRAKQGIDAQRAAERKHLQELAQMAERRRKGVVEFLRKRMQPSLRSNAQPGQRAVRLSDTIEIIMPAKPWRRV